MIVNKLLGKKSAEKEQTQQSFNDHSHTITPDTWKVEIATCLGCEIGVHQCRRCQKSGWVGKNMEKCRVKTCPNFLHLTCFESKDLICKSHKCATCDKYFYQGEDNIAKCIVCEKAVHYDATEEQADITEEVTKTLEKKRRKALDSIKRKIMSKMSKPPPTPEEH